jgi:hypothetical protein
MNFEQDGNRAAAEAQVKGPAVGLMVTAGIGIFFQLISLVLHLLGTGLGAMGGGNERMSQMMSGTVGMVASVIGLVIGGVIFMGASKMKTLQSYGFAMAACILAMIPCISPCCLLGLPIGIWALIVLMKPEVKSAFQA